MLTGSAAGGTDAAAAIRLSARQPVKNPSLREQGEAVGPSRCWMIWPSATRATSNTVMPIGLLLGGPKNGSLAALAARHRRWRGRREPGSPHCGKGLSLRVPVLG